MPGNSHAITTRTVQITIDDALLQVVDKTVSEMDTNCSASIRQALKLALKRIEVLRLEKQHAAGYALHPAAPGEFDGWEAEQVWDALGLQALSNSLTSPRPMVS